MDAASWLQALAPAALAGGAGGMALSLVTAWRKYRAGASEDIDHAIDRLERRLAAVERERDHYARAAARFRRQLVAAGITPEEASS